MNKRFLVFMISTLMVGGTIHAQEYKITKSTGSLIIKEVNDVTIDGYSGNEIIFSTREIDHKGDERAKGLRAISSMGLEDNTGIGLSVIEKGETIEVNQLKKMDGPDVIIKVPKGVKVYYTHTSPYGNDLKLKNFEGTVEVSTVHSNIKLSSITGPATIKTIHGDIDAVLDAPLKSPFSLNSVHGHVDVALPVATKANLQLTTTHGEILIDPDFKIEIDRSGDFVRYSDRLNSKLNGGGVEIELTASHGNLYLRKK